MWKMQRKKERNGLFFTHLWPGPSKSARHPVAEVSVERPAFPDPVGALPLAEHYLRCRRYFRREIQKRRLLPSSGSSAAVGHYYQGNKKKKNCKKSLSSSSGKRSSAAAVDPLLVWWWVMMTRDLLLLLVAFWWRQSLTSLWPLLLVIERNRQGSAQWARIEGKEAAEEDWPLAVLVGSGGFDFIEKRFLPASTTGLEGRGLEEKFCCSASAADVEVSENNCSWPPFSFCLLPATTMLFISISLDFWPAAVCSVSVELLTFYFARQPFLKII